MKKIVIPAALLALSTLAAAQSSVTLFGIVDTNVQRGSGSISSRTQVGNSGNSTSRLGFRGVEDLGGGMSAAFWLESGLTTDNGSGTATSTNNQASGGALAGINGSQGLSFNRRATVSLIGSLGEVRLGRDFSVQYYNRYEVDPFGNNGVGTSQPTIGSLGGPVSTRVSNAIMYLLPPTLGGFYGEAQYYLGENASNAGATANDGKGGGVRLGYLAGPVNVSLAHARTQYATTATTGDITATNLGLRYDFGVAVAMLGWFRDRVDTLAGVTGRGWQVGGTWRLATGDLKAMLSKYGTTAAGSPETRKLAIGYVHNLSKRTAVYGTVARVNNSGGATTALNGATTAANQSSSGFDLGLRHSF